MGTISDTEKITYLFKKTLGVANTQITGEYYSENPNPSRWSIYSTQLFQQLIPTTAPVDLQMSAVSPPDTNVIYKCNSVTYPYIAKYQVLTAPAFPFSSNAYISQYLKNAIAESLDPLKKYEYSLFATSNGNCNVLSLPVNKGNGQWVGDPDSGIVTFYGLESYTNPSYHRISDIYPPVMTFYRYEGAIGPNTFQSVQYA